MGNKEIMMKIDHYLRGDLRESEIEELWIEFVENPGSYDLFETELLLRDLGNKNQGKAVSSHSFQSFFERYKIGFLALAAIITLTFGIFLFSTFQQTDVRNFAIERIDHQEILGADIFRSDKERSVDINLMLNRGLEATLDQRPREAVTLFNSVLKNNPDPVQKMKAQYNLGILYYNLNDFPSSVRSFELIDIYLVEQDYLKEKIMWFLGNAMLRNGQLRESVNVLKKMIGLNGNYLDEAVLLKERLQTEFQEED